MRPVVSYSLLRSLVLHDEHSSDDGDGQDEAASTTRASARSCCDTYFDSSLDATSIHLTLKTAGRLRGGVDDEGMRCATICLKPVLARMMHDGAGHPHAGGLSRAG